MKKATVAGAAVALGFLASPGALSVEGPLELKEERMVIEYTATSGEAAIVVSAEAESRLARLEVRGPIGPALLDLRSGGSELGLLGFVVETGEATPEELFDAYPAGEYHLRARTVDGRTAFGTARFSHALPSVPIVRYPPEGALDVPTTGLVLSWVPDPLADSYRVNLEQGETDVMTVIVRDGSGTFRVPDGVLEGGRRAQLEIGAVGPDGNTTIVEIPFLTR